MVAKSKPKATAARRKAVAKAPKPTGRPTKRTPAITAEICRRLSKGEPLAGICRDAHMPSTRTVSDWRAADADLSADIARAREDGFDAIALETLEIADDDSRDWEAITNDKGVCVGVKVDGEHVTRSKLRIETRLKLLSKWSPARYGDRITAEVTGAGGTPLIPPTTIFELPNNGR